MNIVCRSICNKLHKYDSDAIVIRCGKCDKAKVIEGNGLVSILCSIGNTGFCISKKYYKEYIEDNKEIAGATINKGEI